MNSAPGDRGFTMVELLVVISIMTILTSSVGAALVLGFRLTTNTYSRLDQSNSALAVNRRLTGDLYAAEGTVVLNNTSDASCGGVAPLKLWSRSTASNDGVDQLTVWVLDGTDLVRRVCVNGDQTQSVVAKGIATFTPSWCADCAAPSLTVTFSATGPGSVAPTWSLTVQPRGVAS